MAMDKKACGKEKGCLWCEGGFGPGSCYDEVGVYPTAPRNNSQSQCHSCKTLACCLMLPAALCSPQGQAKFLPKQFYKCKKPKSVMTS